MKIRIHDNVTLYSVEYTILSCDRKPRFNGIIAKTLSWDEYLEKPPSNNFENILVWKKEDLFWEYVKDHNDNTIVMFNYGMKDIFEIFMPDGWNGGFSYSGARDWDDDFYKFKAQQPNAGIYVVPKEYFSVSSHENKTDDDSSYTQGYRDGCTGLKWL